MYADFSYYRDNFGGTLVPETAWPRAAGYASDWMDAATFGRLADGIPEEYETQIKRCCCEMAEQVYIHLPGLASGIGEDAPAVQESIGAYSRTFRSGAAAVSEILHGGESAGLEDVLHSIVLRYLGRTGLLFRGVM